MKRLTEWIDGDTAVPIMNLSVKETGHNTCMKKLADYEDLEEQGLLIKLPCKVGDRLYYLFAGEIIEKEIVCFMTHKHTKTAAFFNVALNGSCELEDFGKTVFLTREEAEEALKKRLEDLK